MRVAPALCLVSSWAMWLGCVAAVPPSLVGTEPTPVWIQPDEPAAPPRPAPMSADEARVLARQSDDAGACARAASALRKRAPQRGWALMEQCARRSDFVDLEALLADPWRDELLRSSTQAEIVVHVVAARGGDVQGDLRLLRRAGLPFSSLSAALSSPDAHVGRWVILRGTSRTARAVGNVRAVEVAETEVVIEDHWLPLGLRRVASGTVDVTDKMQAPASASSSRSRDETWTFLEERRTTQDSGLSILAQEQGEPVLEPDVDLVILLRFDGMRAAVERGVVGERAVATIVRAEEPLPGFIE